MQFLDGQTLADRLALPAIVRILGERRTYNAVNRAGHERLHRRNRRRVVLQNRAQQLRTRFAFKRTPSCDHLA